MQSLCPQALSPHQEGVAASPQGPPHGCPSSAAEADAQVAAVQRGPCSRDRGSASGGQLWPSWLLLTAWWLSMPAEAGWKGSRLPSSTGAPTSQSLREKLAVAPLQPQSTGQGSWQGGQAARQADGSQSLPKGTGCIHNRVGSLEAVEVAGKAIGGSLVDTMTAEDQ